MTVEQPDRIELRALRAVGFCGALPQEQEQPQPFEIDLDLIVELSEAGRSDQLSDTVDYGEMAQVVSVIVTESRFVLLERMAEVIADAMLGHARVQAVTVTVRKLRPPVPVDLATSGVTITRNRADGS